MSDYKPQLNMTDRIISFFADVSELIGKGILWSVRKADKSANSAVFVELMLEIIYDTLKEMSDLSLSTDQETDQDTDQGEFVDRLLAAIGDEELSAVDIMKRFGLSHRPTFRKNYLNPALEKNLIQRSLPNKPNSKNQKYHKIK